MVVAPTIVVGWRWGRVRVLVAAPLVDTGGSGGYHVGLKSDDGRRRHWGLVVMVCGHW